MFKKNFYFIIFLLFIFIFSFPVFSYCAYPKIVQTLTSAFENIKDWIIKIATPAAAVSVGTGVFMKKFSFGEEDRIRTGKRIIRGTLFSYGFLLSIDLILNTIELLLSK